MDHRSKSSYRTLALSMVLFALCKNSASGATVTAVKPEWTQVNCDASRNATKAIVVSNADVSTVTGSGTNPSQSFAFPVEFAKPSEVPLQINYSGHEGRLIPHEQSDEIGRDVTDFLESNVEVFDPLIDALTQVLEIFPGTDEIKLDRAAHCDTGEKYLLVTVTHFGSVAEGYELLDTFYEKWWLDHMQDANYKIQFAIDFPR